MGWMQGGAQGGQVGVERRLGELAAMRMVLGGESAVDLPRLWLPDHAAVDEFLRLASYDPDNPLDLSRVYELHREATVYLQDVHRVRLPQELLNPASVHDVFIAASQATDRLQGFACMTLKVMHILNHINGRELVLNLPISEAQLFDRLNTKVLSVFERLRPAGIAVQEFSAGKKTRHSVLTKLLARRGTLATNIFDRLRFRLIVERRIDVVYALRYLLTHLFPFNYVVPEQSRNGLVTVDDLSQALDLPRDVVLRVLRLGDTVSDIATKGAGPTPPNEFSGRTYRVVSLVAEIPLRLDDILPDASPAMAFAQTEVQIVDAETEAANNHGENAHHQYKKRQLATVRKRLEKTG